jgi:glycosyltransferase involved in cell wall biosynthesis
MRKDNQPRLTQVELSIVLPVYNEYENLPVLMEQLNNVVPGLDYSCEIILVDDGSTDGSLDQMKKLREEYTGLNIRIICLDGNHGLTAALMAGFERARGGLVVSLDADLQNDPADIPKLLANIPEYDVVIGCRRVRRDNFIRRASSVIANAIRNWVTQETVRDVGCTLKVYKKEYLDRLKLYHGLHRFLPTLLKLEGARVAEVEVNHRPRIHGQPKYNISNRLFASLKDLLAVRWMQKRQIKYHSREI